MTSYLTDLSNSNVTTNNSDAAHLHYQVAHFIETNFDSADVRAFYPTYDLHIHSIAFERSIVDFIMIFFINIVVFSIFSFT